MSEKADVRYREISANMILVLTAGSSPNRSFFNKAFLLLKALRGQGKILCSQICDDIELPAEPVVEFSDEKQHHETLIWKCLKRNGVNSYAYLRWTLVFSILRR